VPLKQETIDLREEFRAAEGWVAGLLSLFYRRSNSCNWLKSKATPFERMPRVPFRAGAPSDLAAWRMTVALIMRDVNNALTPAAPVGRRAEEILIARLVYRAKLQDMATALGTSYAAVRVMVESGVIMFSRECESRGLTERLSA
jgi:hypothetical protein